jgi:hypothetical protein
MRRRCDVRERERERERNKTLLRVFRIKEASLSQIAMGMLFLFNNQVKQSKKEVMNIKADLLK